MVREATATSRGAAVAADHPNAKDRVRLRRAMIMLASAQGLPVPDIAELAQVSQRFVRQVIHDFNETGFYALDPKWSRAHPRQSMTSRGRRSAIAGCSGNLYPHPGVG